MENDDIGNIPSAKLVEEWRRLRKTGKRNPLYWSNQHDKNLVASELDRRCVNAGIQLIKDHFEYEYEKVGIMNQPIIPPRPILVVMRLNAFEQHALEAWLLMKGGNP